MKIGTYTKEQRIKAERKASREIDLENQTGWSSKHSVKRSKKTYTRKSKHKNKGF